MVLNAYCVLFLRLFASYFSKISAVFNCLISSSTKYIHLAFRHMNNVCIFMDMYFFWKSWGNRGRVQYYRLLIKCVILARYSVNNLYSSCTTESVLIKCNYSVSLAEPEFANTEYSNSTSVCSLLPFTHKQTNSLTRITSLMGQISYQCKLPALHGNLLRFANTPAWNLLPELNFCRMLQQSVCGGGGVAWMERDEKPLTRWYLWEWTSVTIDIKWRQQMMFFKFTDTNTCLQFLFTLLAGWLFWFYSQVFPNLILILSDFNRNGLQPAVGNGRILSRLNLSK